MTKRIFIIVWLGLVLVMTGLHLHPARAQAEIKLNTLEVDIWPEYDRPSVLVIYHITLPATISLPVDLTIRIPAAAGDPSAVAVRQVSADGQPGLFSIPYQRQVTGEWGLIALTATTPEVQLEYYDPSLVKDGDARQYEFRWSGDYAVEALSVKVQQPMGASAMSLSPSAGAGVTGNDGLVYYNKDAGSLPAGQTFTLSISYEKSSDDLSATSLRVQPAAPVDDTQGETSIQTFLSGALNNKIVAWSLGILGVALIAGGAVWYWQTGKSRQEEQPRRRHRPAVLSEVEEAGGHIYCHQCGKRAGPGDRFCRTCGTKLRSE